jgi:capsular polysaccharide transport system permease protein
MPTDADAPAVPPPTLLHSLSVQRRVIAALMMREVITRFGRRNLGVLWMIGEPMLFTLFVAALWSVGRFSNHSTAIPIIAFAITGYSSVLMWRNTVGRCNSAIQQNFNLLYHRNVRVLDVFITRSLLEIAGATASFVLLSAMFVGAGMIEPPVDPLLVCVGWIMLGWFGFALALVIGSATAYSELVDRLWHPVSYILFPLSGAAFMVDWLPPAGQQAVLLLPMVHGVEVLREGFFGHTVRTHYDLAYMALCCLVLTLLGLLLARQAGNHVESR